MDCAEVDRLLFVGLRIQALAALRDAQQCSMQNAIGALGARFEHLVAERRDEFTVPIDRYFVEFYT